MTERNEMVLRGLRFIFEHALEGENFEDWDGDYLWCFHCVATTSANAEVCFAAREMGTQLARKWQAQQTSLPGLADASEVAYYVSMLDAVRRFGITLPLLHEHVRQGSLRFSSRDYLGFDPRLEAPPSGTRSRYDLWSDALVMTYTGDACGIPMGATYADVLRWLPEMRPYPGLRNGANPEFRDIVLAITHLAYTLNDYNRYRLSPEWLRPEFEYLREHCQQPIQAADPELLGEFVDCLRAFGLDESDPAVTAGVQYLTQNQNADGSWGEVNEPDPHKRYHTAWTAVDALRDYIWLERPAWPEGVSEILIHLQETPHVLAEPGVDPGDAKHDEAECDEGENPVHGLQILQIVDEQL